MPNESNARKMYPIIESMWKSHIGVCQAVTHLIIECTAFIDFLCTYTMALYPGLKNRYHFLYGFFFKRSYSRGLVLLNLAQISSLKATSLIN